MKQSWCPLWSDITTSSIWETPEHVRIVWITLLAMKDEVGFVSASMSGLRRAANLPLERVVEAVGVLESPDPDSRTSDNEGRRIRKVEGGWVVMNHARFTTRISEEYRKMYKAQKMREYRSKASQKLAHAAGAAPGRDHEDGN